MTINQTTLSKISYTELKAHSAWMTVGNYAEDNDAKLNPVKLDSRGRISKDIGEIWCLCLAVFANGSEHDATSMCRADSCDGPMLWSVWNGNEDIPLLLPPAPPPVIVIKGPNYFANKFNLKKNEVFPIKLKVIPHFVKSPEQRSIISGENGIMLEQ